MVSLETFIDIILLAALKGLASNQPLKEIFPWVIKAAGGRIDNPIIFSVDKNLPAATGMYFNLIKNRAIPTYKNETNTKKTLISTHSPLTVTHICVTPHCYSTYQQETITSRSRQLLMTGCPKHVEQLLEEK